MLAIRFKNNRLFYLDQTQLPSKEVWRECASLRQGYRAIKELQVRGAPLIGVFAAYCVWVAVKENKNSRRGSFYNETLKTIDYLQSCRPTAVNLAWALKRLKNILESKKHLDINAIKCFLLAEAEAIHRQDRELCAKIGKFGASLVQPDDVILTHCNAGSLATGGEGTALAVIYEAARRYKNIKVYADETRPLLQGSRLTAWELMKHKIPVTVICDNMAGYVMAQGKIDKIFVGADRITAEGDAANKIGTYSVAVLAKYHKIPFYVAAPFSTFDLNLRKGRDIPIEERSPDEVPKILGKVYVTPEKAQVYNPAFDVTPHKLITAIVTDRGVIRPPFDKNINYFLRRKR